MPSAVAAEPLKLGLIVNPIAGMGGSVGLMGTDGNRHQQALELGAEPAAAKRVLEFLTHCQLDEWEHSVCWHTVAGEMGEGLLRQVQPHADLVVTQLDHLPAGERSRSAAALMLRAGVDMLIFAGGDGTARDVAVALTEKPELPVLGVPCGVKMHSGVFAVSPRAAAQVLRRVVYGNLTAVAPQEIRDFDDRDPQRLSVRQFATVNVPDVGGFMQHTKEGGVENESLVVEEIVAHLLDFVDLNQVLVLGPGSTCYAFKQRLGMSGTLRGFDVRLPNGECWPNVTARQLLQLQKDRENKIHHVVSFTREQGFLFGRGNQQLSHEYLSAANWPNHFTLVGSRTKLSSLQGRPLLVDTGSPATDKSLCGLVTILAGYEDTLLHRVAVDYE